MSDELQTIEAGAAEFERIIGYCELFRSALINAGVDFEDLQEHALIMTAASTFAGTMFGHMIAGGIVRDQDKRRAVDMMSRNFRNGIDVGKSRAVRHLAEMGERQ
ncbi:hypothetical protein [Sphingobium yanoikuyae]|uniref:hypothetical protein n=1 Tax=Sphingobium yanoikuyae TaxID=13690 RepID=UPI0028DB67B4|nr:hypothetical protein [Sphingobium yanoikuyae]